VTDHQAKHFLIEQFLDQASREGVSVSALERKMMELSEGDPDWVRLCEEYDAQPLATISAAKISILLHHTYDRLKKEDREKPAIWEEAVRVLQEGNHYLAKFWALVPLHKISGRTSRRPRLMGSRLRETTRNLWVRLRRGGLRAFFRKNYQQFGQVDKVDSASPTPGPAVAVSVASRRCDSRSKLS
jgi:hypothetical protein